MAKLCLFFNIASLYREAIYTAIDNNYDCEWHFINNKSDIKEFDLSKFKSTKRHCYVGNPNKLYYQFGILRLLFSKRFDTYLYIHDSRSLTCWLFTILAHYMFPKKHIYTWSHGWYGKESKLQILLEGWVFRLMTGVFTYGEYAKNLLIKDGHVDPSKIFPIHNSLDYSKQLIIRNSIKTSDIYKRHFGNNHPVIIFIGRLTAVKKLDQLISAIARLKKKHENYNVVFIGDGVKRDELELQIKNNNLNSNVWFYGSSFDENENAELIYNADLCVSPGNIGLTAIHVMMFGCPAISHNDYKWQMPEFEAIKPGETGDFFEKGNVDDLANVISKWFKQHMNNRDEIRKRCFDEIDFHWTPNFQLSVLKKNLIL